MISTLSGDKRVFLLQHKLTKRLRHRLAILMDRRTQCGLFQAAELSPSSEKSTLISCFFFSTSRLPHSTRLSATHGRMALGGIPVAKVLSFLVFSSFTS
jgi:hypothetical protein